MTSCVSIQQLYTTTTTTTVKAAMYRYVDADPRHFDITYLVFNMKFHQRVMRTHRLSAGGKRCCSFNRFTPVGSFFWSAQTQQSTDVSDVSLHYTVCVITSLYV